MPLSLSNSLFVAKGKVHEKSKKKLTSVSFVFTHTYTLEKLQGVSEKRYFFDFCLIYVLEIGFYFFIYLFLSQNFEPVPSSHSNYIHPKSKLP